MPKVLLGVRRCESHDNYQAVNRTSGAGGAYQFLPSSWKSYGYAAKYGVARAEQATPAQQDEAAVATYLRSGTSPWGPSRGCWS
jgi:muramidase (phage lysozyme)